MTLPSTFVEGFHDLDAVTKMKYNPLGETGLLVSHLGFGGGGLANFYESFDEEEAISVVRQAIKRGINYIDTAAYYGKDRSSERILGKALKGVPRQAYYIGTKVGRFSADVATGFDFSYKRTLESVDESLQLLGLEYVDVIQAHDIEFAPNLDIVVNETIPALVDSVKAGKARFIGVTGYPISVLKEAIERSQNKIDCVLCYARSTLHDDTLLGFLPFFQGRKMGIISAAGTSMSMLTNKGPFPWHPAHQEIKDACSKAAEMCKSQGVELGRLAAFHSLSVQGPATHLLGINCSKVLEDNLDVCLNGLTESEEKVLNEIKEKCFAGLTKKHWEGVEVSRYRAAYEKLVEEGKIKI
ncbi:uncharacterized protein LOC132192466 [Neocloeon triangulifer]|uniref:uncharacterized protein LOC132192466 n=1 Tax=Neocloeon triangulifer TaxID=2078957 RepID=UPI00286F5B91|nr:uncharacterized protein LOC132192466 [Neocloeon triangulifer]XP_059468426.1 uncharacterized protein LOC132192466 [Neocloeon triangulifer]XP_059468427.1 uncharacterized protein LOC132192466 [Neocloeon triangulifer]